MAGERGAALLITLVLITVIGSIAFGVGRSTLTDFRQVTRLEDSLNAYQAAQAGIEEALLRFRFDKNAETPDANSCGSNTDPTEASTLFARVDISTNVRTCVDLLPTLPFTVVPDDASHIVYDLKMSYRKTAGQGECIATALTPGCTQAPGGQPALPSDTALEYNVKDLTSLRVTAQFAASPIPRLEVIQLDAGGTVVDQDLFFGPTITNQNIFLSGATEKIRMRSFGDVSMYRLDVPSGETLDSRLTTVESVGYYGVSKRKLKLTLDRLSGTVFEVFDFVLYSDQGGISPTP